MALTKVKAGNIILTTPSSSSNDTTPATTQYVTTAINDLIDTAPSTLNTLNELAAALGDDVNFSTTVTNSIATKLPLAGGSLTGDLLMRNGGNIELGGYNSGNDKGLILSPQDGSGYWHVYNTAGGHLAFGASNTIGSSEKMRIAGSGNVGIGNSSPSSLYWPNGSTGGLFLQAGGLLSAYNAGTNLSQNWYYNSGEKFIGNGGASRYVQSGQEHIWSHSTAVNSSGAGAGLTWSESMRIDSSGNVGIGTSSPSQQLTVFNSSAPKISLDYSGGANNGGSIDFNLINGGVPDALTTQIKVIDDGAYRQHLTFLTKTSGAASSGMTERMRLDSSGRVGINRTPSVGNSKLEIGGADGVRLVVVEASGHTGGIGIQGGTASNKGFLLMSGGQIKIQLSDQTNVAYTADGLFNANARPSRYKTSGSGQMLLGYQDNGSGLYSGAMGLEYDCVDGLGNTSYVGGFMMKDTASGTVHVRIETQGDMHNTNNSYGSISDSRVKTDIIDASSQWDDVKALRIRKYKLATQPAPFNDQFQIGVIAQELESAGMNGLIKESEPDEAQLNYAPELVGEKVKSVKYSILYMKAIKALQEAMTRIETLEARVTELES